MTGLDYTTLNPGIRKVVKYLRDQNFDTCDSGDGITNIEAGMEGALDIPHVHCRVDCEELIVEANYLHRLMETLGLGQVATIEATYFPSDGVAIISLLNVDDKLLSNALNEAL